MSGADVLRGALASLAAGAGERLVPPVALAACDTALMMFAAARPELVLELHVGAPRPVVDLTLRVHQRDAASLLDERLPYAVRRAATAWTTAGTALSLSPFVELEFDIESEPSVPWIGPAVEPELRRGPVWIQEARDRGTRYPGPPPASAESVVRLLEELGGADARTVERTRAFVASLPRLGILSQLALLAGRPSAPRHGVRLFVSVPINDLDETLARAGWPGDVGRVRALRDAFVPASSWVDVDFGMSADVTEPALGFYREFRAPRLADSSLREVFDIIRAMSLTAHDRLDALRAWVVANEGRLDRMISFKVALLPNALRLKVYLSALGTLAAHDGLSSRQHGQVVSA